MSLLANESVPFAVSHAKHAAFHYGEDEVKKAVNNRKRALAKKHGALDSLRLEA
jgi:hypothetical protein